MKEKKCKHINQFIQKYEKNESNLFLETIILKKIITDLFKKLFKK